MAVLNSLLEGLFVVSQKSSLPIAGLLTDPKGDFTQKLDALSVKYGRTDDLYRFDPETWATDARTKNSCAYNPLDNEQTALEISSSLILCHQLLGLETKETYFLDSAKIFMMHAITLLRAAAEPDEPPSLLDVYALGTEPVGEEAGPLYFRLTALILQRFPDYETLPVPLREALKYFEDQWRKMEARQHSAVVGTLTQLLGEFITEPYRDMISGKSTISMGDVLDKGRIFHVNMPLAKNPRMARLITVLIKREYQNAVLRRVNKERPSFLFCDEFPSLYVSGKQGQGDSDFVALSRQSRNANIFAAQSMSSFLSKASSRDDVLAFLGNCGVKIFLRNTERDTNEWASSLFGERSAICISASTTATMDDPSLGKRAHTNYSRSTKNVRVVPPGALTKLAVLDANDPNCQYAESIIHLATRATTEQLNLNWKVNPIK